MTPSEYRYQIEEVHYDCTADPHWELSDDQFKLFADMARHSKSRSLVLDNWKIFLDGSGGSPEDYFEWWETNRPDNLQEAIKKPEVIKKYSPFDAVKRIVRIE